jgi:AMP-polyphosphate phosphotransferase
MLENINLARKLPREEYKSASRRCRSASTISKRPAGIRMFPRSWHSKVGTPRERARPSARLTQRLDPRGFKLYPITAPRTYEQQRPWLWRFWLKVPNRGEMIIFDHSWYGRVLEERVERTIPEKAWRQAYRDIVEFERTLADDGTTSSNSSSTSARRNRRRDSRPLRRTRWKRGA